MQLIFFTDSFEKNYDIVNDRFKTGSVNVMKNRRLLERNKGNFNIY